MATAVPFMPELLHEQDPVLAALLCAPTDPTPETDEEREAVEEGMAAIRAGQWVRHDEVHAMIERRRREEG